MAQDVLPSILMPQPTDKLVQRFHTSPAALLLPRGTKTWTVVDHQHDSTSRYEQITQMAQQLGVHTLDCTPTVPACIDISSNHHINVTANYYHGKGDAHVKQADYDQALHHHRQALTLQQMLDKAEKRARRSPCL